MKKMLIMLFLLFAFIGVDPMSIPNLSKIELDAIDQRNKIREILYTNIEEQAEKAYLHWDSIPIQTPMKFSDIKRLSSDFGYRIHPIYKIRSFHKGVDLAGSIGADVYSTANGVVTKVKRSRVGYGNQVVVQHGNGYSTRYAHLNDICVSEGDNVKLGDLLGSLGTTGLSTGGHLHYEVQKDGTPIDPLFFSYKKPEERSQKEYFSLMITLDEHRKLGMYHI